MFSLWIYKRHHIFWQYIQRCHVSGFMTINSRYAVGKSEYIQCNGMDIRKAVYLTAGQLINCIMGFPGMRVHWLQMSFIDAITGSRWAKYKIGGKVVLGFKIPCWWYRSKSKFSRDFIHRKQKSTTPLCLLITKLQEFEIDGFTSLHWCNLKPVSKHSLDFCQPSRTIYKSFIVLHFNNFRLLICSERLLYYLDKG